MSGPFDLTGRRAVVTGASRGIGAAIARALVDAGADVVLLQRSCPDPALLAAAAAAGRRVEAVTVDLADAESIRAAVASVLAGGDVDILVNNAGTQIRHDAVEFPWDDFQAVLDVNLRAVVLLCQGFGRAMLERGYGKIINLASLLSYQGGLRVPAYAASKGAVTQYTKALCNEWAGRGVNVNAVAPGYIDTEMNTALIADPGRSRQISERIPAGRWGRPEDLGGAVVFLASRASDYVSGITIAVDGGWLAR